MIFGDKEAKRVLDNFDNLIKTYRDNIKVIHISFGYGRLDPIKPVVIDNTVYNYYVKQAETTIKSIAIKRFFGYEDYNKLIVGHYGYLSTRIFGYVNIVFQLNDGRIINETYTVYTLADLFERNIFNLDIIKKIFDFLLKLYEIIIKGELHKKYQIVDHTGILNSILIGGEATEKEIDELYNELLKGSKDNSRGGDSNPSQEGLQPSP